MCAEHGALWTERLVFYLGRLYPHAIRYGSKGCGRESDEVIVGVTAEGTDLPSRRAVCL